MNPPRSIICFAFAGLVSTSAAADSVTDGQPPIRIRPVAPPKACPFNLQDVRFLDGPFKQGQDIAVKYLLSLEADRLLANFRKEAGLEPKATRYGGWEAEGIAGHSLGHYLSACSLA